MAIQIPTLKRLDPVADAPADRLKVDMPDSSHAMAKESKMVGNLGNDASDYFAKVENEAADTEGIKRSLEYQKTWTVRNQQLRNQDGNPADLYAQFDKDMGDEFKRLSDDPALSGAAKDYTLKHMTDRANMLDMQRLNEAGAQQARYDENLHNADIASDKQALSQAAILAVQSGDNSQFEKLVGGITQKNLQWGIKRGSVVPDDNGRSWMLGEDGKPKQVTALDTVTLQNKKDLSQGIHDALDNLISSDAPGAVDTARKIKEQFGSYMVPEQERAINNAFKAKEMNDLSYEAARDPKVLDTIKNPVVRDQVRDKANQINDERGRRSQDLIERSSTRAYNVLSNHITDVQTNGNGFAGINEFQNDKVTKQLLSKVTDERQKRVLIERVLGGPKTSNEEASAKIQNLWLGRDPEYDLKTISPEDYDVHFKYNLSKQDKAKADRMLEGAQGKNETAAQETSRYKAGSKELEEQLIGIGYIKRDMFNRVSGKEEKKLIDVRNEMDDKLAGYGPGPISPKDMKDFAKNLAVSRQTGEAFKAPDSPRFNGGGKKTVDPTTGGKLYKGHDRVYWNKEYLKLGKGPADQDQLNKFISEQ